MVVMSDIGKEVELLVNPNCPAEAVNPIGMKTMISCLMIILIPLIGFTATGGVIMLITLLMNK